MPSPLTGRPPPEVHLTNAPVARVIAQVRFPPIASLNQQAFIGPFQEAIRDEYAVMRSAAANRVQVTMPGQPRIDLSTDHAWLFHDLNHPWRAVLASDFLALETRAYTSRADLLLRLDRLVAALAIHVRPGAIDRIGVRYIDRLTGDALCDVDRLVRPDLLGVMGTDVFDHALVCATEAHLQLAEERGVLRVRWGWLPAGVALDPNGLEPVDEPSWVLDLDAFREGERPFEPGAIVAEAQALAERAYGFYRWSVTDAFLTRFGGTP